jgi:hypothetical protein
MKRILIVITIVLYAHTFYGQITRPQIKSGFGVEAELEASLFGSEFLADDWFSNLIIAPGSAVIDTAGASEILGRYVSEPATLNRSFTKRMSRPVFSLVNGNRWMDAVYVRDFHGDDSTVYASGGNKNGQSPADWNTPVAQSVPDKTEILDVFMHVRRNGPQNTDSLWMFGGVSIENTTGNRYFDFEMYQTDIAYDRTNMRFTGYGPDAGHTSWKFDSRGNVIQPGDIILTAEYSSSSLTLIQARIWIRKADLGIDPVNFNWSGDFDGAGSGSAYGYASILPATSGPFYSGLQNEDNAWGGPFKIVLGNNDVVTHYIPRQFMEFAVNLTKLGLDPITLLGASSCDRPFRRVMVKTRSSTSFTSELKDFVAPFDYLNPPPVELFTDVPIFCGVISVSNIKITNPLATSVYSWSTPDGHFADTSNPASVYVDQPGTYIVQQRLQADCPVFSADTVVIDFDSTCGVVAAETLDFRGAIESGWALLQWKHLTAQPVVRYELQRSSDGIRFISCGQLMAPAGSAGRLSLKDILPVSGTAFYYRLKISYQNRSLRFSEIIRIERPENPESAISIYPNPVTGYVCLDFSLSRPGLVRVELIDPSGKIILQQHYSGTRGLNRQRISGLSSLPRGIYNIKVVTEKNLYSKRLMFLH